LSHTSKELILHIGPHKTGSTAIQKTLRTHAKLLNSFDVASATLQWDLPAVHKAFAQKDPETVGFKSAVADAQQEFSEWLSQHKQRRIIISGEDMSRFFTPWTSKARIAHILFGDFENITIIVYARRQDRSFESNYQTWIKRGILVREDSSVKPFMQHVEDPDFGINRLNWLEGINDYKYFFPNARYVVKCYELVVEKYDISRDFLESIGINELPDEVRSSLSNRGLNDVGREIMAIARATLSNEDAAFLGDLLEVRFPLVRDSSLRGYGLFTREQRTKIVSQFHEANEELFEAYHMGTKEEFARWECIEEETDKPSLEPRKEAIVHLIKSVIECEKKRARWRK